MIAALLFMISIAPLSVLAQSSFVPELPEQTIRHYCGAPEILHGAAFDEVTAIAERLTVGNARIRIVVSMSPEINAWEVEAGKTSLICVPVALVHAMGGREGELAFVLAHEMGHATDDRCRSREERARAANESKSGALLALLFGGGDGDGVRDQRVCESRADELGVNSISRAGYDPEDAALALGRLATYWGDTSTGPLRRLAALGKDHPITPDRIRRIRKLIARQSKEALQ
jgi:predicted Zn-dependent protease